MTTKSIVIVLNALFLMCLYFLIERRTTNAPVLVRSGVPESRVPVMEVPKTRTRKIWTLWLQPVDTAPQIVQDLLALWKAWYPQDCDNLGTDNWQLTIIDENTLQDHISSDMYEQLMEVKPAVFSKLSYAAWSDLIRLALLKEQGGVWADATLAPMKHLDDWLWESTGNSTFFCYTTDSVVSRGIPIARPASWFLYAEPDNYLITEWLKYSLHLWKTVQPKEKVGYFWLHDLFMSRSRADPHFYHELMKVRSTNYSPFNKMDEKTLKVDNGQNLVVMSRIVSDLTPSVKKFIDTRATGVAKLSYKLRGKQDKLFEEGSVFEYLKKSTTSHQADRMKEHGTCKKPSDKNP